MLDSDKKNFYLHCNSCGAVFSLSRKECKSASQLVFYAAEKGWTMKSFYGNKQGFGGAFKQYKNFCPGCSKNM